MCTSLIKFFVTNWLLFCLINPFCNGEKSYWVPSEINNLVYQFQSDPGSIEKRPSLLLREPSEKSHDNIFHHDYQPNAMHSKISSKSIYPGMKSKSISDYEAEKKLPYKFSGYQHAKNQEILKNDSDEEVRRRDEEIMKKMNALEKFLSEDNNENNVEARNTIEDRSSVEMNISEETKRVVRQVRRQRPGFFWTLARLAFETFNDTRSAIQQISSIINENIQPDISTRPSPVTSNSFVVTDATTNASSDDQSNIPSNMASISVTPTMTTTTPAPFRLTRTRFQSLIRRNLRGLVRLFNLEWQDALSQSEVNVREFQKNLGNQVGSYLRDNPNAF